MGNKIRHIIGINDISYINNRHIDICNDVDIDICNDVDVDICNDVDIDICNDNDNKLPNEIWNIIFRFLSYNDLVNLLILGNSNKLNNSWLKFNRYTLLNFIDKESRMYWNSVYLGHIKRYLNAELNMIKGAIETYGIIQIIGNDLGVVNYSDFGCYFNMKKTEKHIVDISDRINNISDSNYFKIENIYLDIINFENQKAIDVIIKNFRNLSAKCLDLD